MVGGRGRINYALDWPSKLKCKEKTDSKLSSVYTTPIGWLILAFSGYQKTLIGELGSDLFSCLNFNCHQLPPLNFKSRNSILKYCFQFSGNAWIPCL
jgi:hypothetical protein